MHVETFRPEIRVRKKKSLLNGSKRSPREGRHIDVKRGGVDIDLGFKIGEKPSERPIARKGIGLFLLGIDSNGLYVREKKSLKD